MRKKLAIVMALLAGTLMVPNQEALARGSGWEGGFHGGGTFHGGSFGARFGGFRGARFNHFAGGFDGSRFGHRGRFGRGFGFYGGYPYYSYGCDPYDYYGCIY